MSEDSSPICNKEEYEIPQFTHSITITKNQKSKRNFEN